jgi:predicted HTH transcriptional regulator
MKVGKLGLLIFLKKTAFKALFIGVADDGSIPGMTRKDVSRINQLISNAASHLVRNPLMSGKTSGKIVELMKENAFIIIPEPAEKTGVTERSGERNIQKLQDSGIIRRVGPAKGGHWEVLR